MANADITCPKCKKQMEEGFVPDYTYGGVLATKWVEGPLERGWLGVKLRGKKAMAITTYRCVACGYVESYAR
jgi:Domain of unknown function (DUF6487)